MNLFIRAKKTWRARDVPPLVECFSRICDIHGNGGRDLSPQGRRQEDQKFETILEFEADSDSEILLQSGAGWGWGAGAGPVIHSANLLVFLPMSRLPKEFQRMCITV